jgi:integrase/transcriptional regulator with XRE-family HTH domain
MKGKYNEISYVENQRYFVVMANNVMEVTKSGGVFASSYPLELTVSISYTELNTKLKENYSIDDTPSASALQQYRNHMSALNGYLTFCGKSVDSNVGAELSSQFDTKLREYLACVELAPRTRRDRTNQLRTIQKLYQVTLGNQRAPLRTSSSLSTTLRLRIAETGVAPKTLAKQAGVDPTTLWRWMNGASPRDDTVPALRRLEVRLGLERDTLVQLIHKRSNTDARPVVIPAHRLLLAERSQRPLTLPESALGESFLREWNILFDYKISNFPALERQSRGRWRLIPKSMSMSVSKLAQRGAMVCPTANIFIDRMRHFLGILTHLPSEEGGLSFIEPPPQTLAWCAHPLALECYLQWITNQSGGIRHNGQKVFARAVASLVRPHTGFLWQEASTFRVRLPSQFQVESDDAWRVMCARSHKFLRDYICSATGVSRNPEEPIADLLALQNPLQPIRDAIARIQADAAKALPGSITEARHKRNALVLALLLSNPLRARTLAALTWQPNGRGTLRGSPCTGWRIQLQPAHLKTGDTKQSRIYDVKISDWVKPLLDEYIEEYRETLLAGKTSTYLLVGDEEGGIWESLGHTVRKLTSRYIPGSPGFGPHAVRHLVATAWLREHPGDFLTVSELLNDTLETVLKNYAHLRRDDSFARYDDYLNKGNS